MRSNAERNFLIRDDKNFENSTYIFRLFSSWNFDIGHLITIKVSWSHKFFVESQRSRSTADAKMSSSEKTKQIAPREATEYHRPADV